MNGDDRKNVLAYMGPRNPEKQCIVCGRLYLNQHIPEATEGHRSGFWLCAIHLRRRRGDILLGWAIITVSALFTFVGFLIHIAYDFDPRVAFVVLSFFGGITMAYGYSFFLRARFPHFWRRKDDK